VPGLLAHFTAPVIDLKIFDLKNRFQSHRKMLSTFRTSALKTAEYVSREGVAERVRPEVQPKSAELSVRCELVACLETRQKPSHFGTICPRADTSS
jgi:hypothetical protein